MMRNTSLFLSAFLRRRLRFFLFFILFLVVVLFLLNVIVHIGFVEINVRNSFGHLNSDEMHRSGSGNKPEDNGIQPLVVGVRVAEIQSQRTLVVLAQSQTEDGS